MFAAIRLMPLKLRLAIDLNARRVNLATAAEDETARVDAHDQVERHILVTRHEIVDSQAQAHGIGDQRRHIPKQYVLFGEIPDGSDPAFDRQGLCLPIAL